MRTLIPPGLVILVCCLAACGEDKLTVEQLGANLPPDTQLDCSPPDSSSGVDYRVHLSWLGSDPDGTVDHFDFIMIDHPAVKDNIDGSGPETVVLSIPEPTDPRWQSTTSSDSTFVTLADTLRHPPQPDDSSSADDIRSLPWERWHTFFIRSVDDRGAPDASPDYVSFNAVNIAPQVWLTSPVRRGQPYEVRPSMQISWDGQDPVGDGDMLDPVASRWVLIDTQLDEGGEPLSYPDSLYTLPSRYSWSAWQPWGENGGTARIEGLDPASVLPDGSVTGHYLFAVQVMDEAGAISVVMDRETFERNNSTLVKVREELQPTLTVREQFLVDEWTTTTDFDIAPGQPLNFQLVASAAYGVGQLEFRFVWDGLELGAWRNDWDPSGYPEPYRYKALEERSYYASGVHQLRIQLRDDLGGFNEKSYQFRVLGMPLSRDILWVDDTQEIIPGSGQEAAEDTRWLSILGDVTMTHGVAFDAALDVHDVEQQGIPSMQKLFDYKAVIWSVRGGSALSGLTLLASYYDARPDLPEPPRGRGYNYLLSYLENGGKIWVHGDHPGASLWGKGSSPPVNVSATDDSAATESLLYQMGVELFDCGSGVGCGQPPDAPRDTRVHRCQGFGVAPESQLAGLPELTTGPNWAPDPPNTGRPGIEIFNMPNGMAAQDPPLMPRAGVMLPLYTYKSGVPENIGDGTVYPYTADRQPVAIAAKKDPADTSYSRVLCGFEPELLMQDSHRNLTEYVLVNLFGLGVAGAP